MSKSRDYKQLLDSMLQEWKWLLKFIIRYKFILVLYIFLGLVGTVMSFGVAIATKFLIDAVVSHGQMQLLKSAIFVVVFALSQIVFQAVASWVTAIVSSNANNEIREEIYSRILKSNWSDICCFHSGDLLNRLENDVSTVSTAVINFIPSVFTRSLQFFGSLCIVLYYDTTMALLALLSAPFIFISSRVLVKTIRKFSKQSRELNGQILSYSEESVQNLQVIKAFDLTKDYINNFKAVLVNYRNVKLSYDKFSILMTMCLSLIGLLVSYSCYGWGVYRLWQGAITYGTMTLFLQISGSLTSSFGSLASLVPSAISIATSAGRIMEITGFEEESDDDKDKALEILDKSKNCGVKLVFENVMFKYSEEQAPVLQNISVKINPGEVIAFIGPSGEGKTTLFKLILGLMKPTFGKIYLESADGDVIEVSDSTRRFCSYVPQNINIFTGSISENLRMVKPEATNDELINVLKKAALYDFTESLPKGMNTPVKEQGANFSQGQLQRLAIARALLREASILLMDEATAALDPDTESTVLKNIIVRDPSKICIMTTHRESVLEYCDKVFKISSDGNLTCIK